jgi:hypothetical protein
VTNGLKVLAESLIIHKIQYIVINYINLFVFDDEIEMYKATSSQGLLWLPKSGSQKNRQVPFLKVRSQFRSQLKYLQGRHIILILSQPVFALSP